jgi:diaminopimelate decarboxylase
MVLPITAETDAADHLVIGGCDTVELAREFGTPLFVLDEATLTAQCREYMNKFAAGPTPVDVIYAGKAFMCLALCQIIAREGLSIDVSSGGELYVAVASGFPAERIYMHGNNKTPQELEMALEYGVGTIVVDSFDEMALLDRLAAGRRQNVFIRLTPGIKPQTHQYIQTGQVDSKFGFGIGDGTAAKAIERLKNYPNLELTGFHAHIGSQIFALGSFGKTVEILFEYTAKVRDETGFMPRKIDMGGGLGIKYLETDQPSSIQDFAGTIFAAAAAASQKLNLALPELAVEPGRSIVANSCVTLYRVGTVKEIPGVRTYISVDGGMSDNIRPMLYGAQYTAMLANRMTAPREQEVTVAGKHCESGDVLIKEIKLPKIEIGDILCTPATGAYGYAMASNFNLQPKPAVVMVKDGNARLIIERESYEDLIRKQHRLED